MFYELKILWISIDPLNKFASVSFSKVTITITSKALRGFPFIEVPINRIKRKIERKVRIIQIVTGSFNDSKNLESTYRGPQWNSYSLLH